MQNRVSAILFAMGRRTGVVPDEASMRKRHLKQILYMVSSRRIMVGVLIELHCGNPKIINPKTEEQ